MILLLLFLSCGGRHTESEAPAAPTPTHLPGADLETNLQQTRTFSANRPVYEQPLGDGIALPPNLPDLRSSTCGSCHQEIYEEWKVSTHAAAWTDPQLQEEMKKSGNRWLCVNCHTPLREQQDFWPVGLQNEDVEAPILVPNPKYDPTFQAEGIGCAGCHVRNGEIHGPGLPDSAPPHGVVADPAYTNGELCLRCHQATATYPGKTFVCTFNTGAEFREAGGPEKGQTCATCHMPRVERPVAAGGPVRSVARHWWRGAGIAKHAGVYPPVEANPPALGLTTRVEAEQLVLTTTNVRAGHMLPTGDPERWVQVEIQFQDHKGQVIGEPWQTRFGQKWEWWPAPKKLDDNRLKPGESRDFPVSVPAGAITAEVIASSHRMSTETRDYHKLTDYPIAVETHRLQIPLAPRPPVAP